MSVLSRFEAGEWVDADLLLPELGLSFADAMFRFEFRRDAVWWSICGRTPEERARHGQKVTCYFRKRGVPNDV